MLHGFSDSSVFSRRRSDPDRAWSRMCVSRFSNRVPDLSRGERVIVDLDLAFERTDKGIYCWFIRIFK